MLHGDRVVVVCLRRSKVRLTRWSNNCQRGWGDPHKRARGATTPHARVHYNARQFVTFGAAANAPPLYPHTHTHSLSLSLSFSLSLSLPRHRPLLCSCHASILSGYEAENHIMTAALAGGCWWVQPATGLSAHDGCVKCPTTISFVPRPAPIIPPPANWVTPPNGPCYTPPLSHDSGYLQLQAKSCAYGTADCPRNGDGYQFTQPRIRAQS